MSDPNPWQESNARQLAAALANLRQRLERYIREQAPAEPAPPIIIPPSASDTSPPASASAPSATAPGKVSRSFFERMLGAGPPSPEPLALPPPPESTATPSAEESKQTEALPSALAMLSDQLGLSTFEQQVLLLCAALELDPDIAVLCARAYDPNKPFPTFALARALFDGAWDVLSPERPLRYWRLIEINQPGAQPLTTSALRADERIVNYLNGQNDLDDRLAPFLAPLEFDAASAEVAPSQGAIVETIVRHWQHAAGAAPLPVVQLLGADPISKQLVALHAAAKINRRLHRLPLELLPTAPGDLETLARLWQRESRLLPLALYLDAEDLDAAAGGRFGPLIRFLTRSDGVFFLGVREAVPRAGRSYVALDIPKPTATEQHAAWAEEFGADAPDSPARLAAQFNLNLPNLRALARLARAEVTADAEPLDDKAWDVCCASERPHLSALAQRIEPKMTWKDLVLPEPEMKLLHQIAAQVGQRNKVYNEWGFARKMNRGFGICALFAGDSGTGKTMAAEVIANALNLNLYRIDLSAVVDKYIGVTEKNLCRLFDAADDGGCILCFDECDSLFGKRSEVKDSHDRYANIEINYLLQRIESYRGCAILATNMKSALDTAFLRRLRFVVNFPFPGVADRRRLWEKVFLQEDTAQNLPAPPLGKLDYDRLSRLNLTGGHVQNVALNACFMAAALDTKITMPVVLEAVRAEFIKLERPINEADFRWVEPEPAAQKPAPTVAEPALV